VDTLGQVSQVELTKAWKPRRTIKERRDIVEETLVPGASVARVARRHDVNANQVFYWRKLYREGPLGISMATHLLPVKVVAEKAAETVQGEDLTLSLGSMEIELPRGTLRSLGLWTWWLCVRRWSVCSDDRAGGGYAHLDRGGGG
jgi:transposase